MNLKIEIVQSFAAAHYPHLKLAKEMLEQLGWVQSNSIHTSQSNVQSTQTLVNIEVKRILSRYNCLKLLTAGDAASYKAFVQSQSREHCLSEKHFSELSTFIKSLAPSEALALMASCFITKSDEAIQAVPQEKRASLPNDSEQFISYVVSQFPDVFPICALLSQASIQALPYAFYPHAHARQMLDMEGGYAMLSSFREGIASKKINYGRYKLWLARWIINIAGLDGHIQSQGSSYLTEPVSQCILALQLELEELWKNIKHPVLDKYLAFRARQLKTENFYVAYLAALMRKYDPHTALQIQDWFEHLSPEQQNKRLRAFKRQLEDTMVSTYKPTVLDALLSIGCSISDTLSLYIKLKNKALQVYKTAEASGAVSKETPLSFRNLALKEHLVWIKDYYYRFKKLPPLEIDSSGNVLLKIPALQEEKTLAPPSLQAQALFLKNKSNGQIHKYLQQQGFFNDKALKKLSFRNARECSQKKYQCFAETILMNKGASVNEINEKFAQGLMGLKVG